MYPITYVQFQSFVDDKEMGFDYHEWRRDLAPEFQKQRIAEQRYKYNNHPRDNVNWYEAVAFCRWLTAKLPSDAWPSGEIPVGEDWIIRLPTEWEWQQTATGGQKDYKYPWGKERDRRRANVIESGIERTTAVGMYPAGVSPVGAMDMAGNVWEWCLTRYANPTFVHIMGTDDRVQRGGSFDHPTSYVRAISRRRFYPHLGANFNGFRVALGPVPPDSGL
jgi:formylglycine-generating enzyme required for sulfatase activity